MLFRSDGTTAKAYTDGVLQPGIGTATGSIAGGGLPLVIGGNSELFQLTDGTVDEVRISRSVRYTSNFTPARTFTVDANTVAYYQLNEGTGTTAHDSTALHNGTLKGNPLPSWVQGR